MTRVDFYQLSRDPAERAAPMLAHKVLSAGARLLVVSGEGAQREALSRALWEYGRPEGDACLANGEAGGPHDARQPILISADCEASNGASMVLLADGQWREEAAGFERVLLLFGADMTQGARELWRALSAREGFEPHIFKQREGGDWRAGA